MSLFDLDPMPILHKEELVKGAKYFCDADSFIYGWWTGEYFESFFVAKEEPLKVIEYYLTDETPEGNLGTVRPFYRVLDMKELDNES